MLQRIVDGRTDLVFDYFAEGPGTVAQDSGGVPLIRWCAYYGDVSAIRFLISRGQLLTALGENIGLGSAAFHGHWQLCEFLIERGADVNHAAGDTGETPLHLALSKANRPSYDLVVKVLLGAGADAKATTRTGVESGAFMRDCRTKGETPLHRAAAFGSEEAIQLLLDAGASIEAKDVQGDSPLTWASWHLRPDSILRKLCYGDFSIHPERRGTYDHGAGWGTMELGLLGKPRNP
jgi:hypothetical protein